MCVDITEERGLGCQGACAARPALLRSAACLMLRISGSFFWAALFLSLMTAEECDGASLRRRCTQHSLPPRLQQLHSVKDRKQARHIQGYNADCKHQSMLALRGRRLGALDVLDVLSRVALVCTRAKTDSGRRSVVQKVKREAGSESVLQEGGVETSLNLPSCFLRICWIAV